MSRLAWAQETCLSLRPLCCVQLRGPFLGRYTNVSKDLRGPRFLHSARIDNDASGLSSILVRPPVDNVISSRVTGESFLSTVKNGKCV